MQHWFYLLYSNPQTLFTAISSVATTAAVIVSLCLANRKEYIRLKMSLFIEGIMITKKRGEPKIEFKYSLACTNLSDKNVFIDAIFVGFKGNKYPKDWCYLPKTWQLRYGERKVMVYEELEAREKIGRLLCGIEKHCCVSLKGLSKRRLKKIFHKNLTITVQSTVKNVKYEIEYDTHLCNSFDLLYSILNDDKLYANIVEKAKQCEIDDGAVEESI